MAVRKYLLDEDQQLTEEQFRMVREGAKRPVILDDDNPELTDEQMSFFHSVYEERQTAVDRMFPFNLLHRRPGKRDLLVRGDTGILSRIVESTLNDSAALSKYFKENIIRRYDLTPTYAQNFLDDDSYSEESRPWAL